MSSYLITGTSRGIGLELVKKLVEEPTSKVSKVFAVSRKPGANLESLAKAFPGRIVPTVIDDLANPNSVQKAVVEVEKHLDGAGLDVLVNNAAIMPITPSGRVDSLPADVLKEALEVNVVAPHVLTAAFLPLLQKGREKKIVNISTTLGSFAHADRFRHAPTDAYKISKTAFNRLTLEYSMQFRDQGFTIFAISPGYLKTELGTDGADLDPDVGVRCVKEIIEKADQSMDGTFQNIHVSGWESAPGPNQYDGREVPW